MSVWFPTPNGRINKHSLVKIMAAIVIVIAYDEIFACLQPTEMLSYVLHI